jgi:predicted DNA-binding transcriptional regulator AlpA
MPADEPRSSTAGEQPFLIHEGASYQLLSTRNLMAIFGRSDRTIRNWVAAGHLHPIKVGRSVFFGKHEIDALVGVPDIELKEPDLSAG